MNLENTGDRVTISFVVGLKKGEDRGISHITSCLYGSYFNHITNYLKWALLQQQVEFSIFLYFQHCFSSQNVWWEITSMYHYDINQNVFVLKLHTELIRVKLKDEANLTVQ